MNKLKPSPMIVGHMPIPSNGGCLVQRSSSNPNGAVLSLQARLLSHCDGDEELRAELMRIFRESTPEIVGSIEEALRQQDATAVAAQAHKLLSSLRYFGADAAEALAARLEQQGQENHLPAAKKTFENLEREINKIHAALA